MGARQSKRSVDITTTPKKGEGEVVAEGEGKLEKIGDADIKAATNGAVPHIELVEKDENEKDAAAEKDTKEEPKENGLSESEDAKTPDAEQSEENLTEKTPESGNETKIEDTPETKKQKEKNKKKKWSFRSISFSKKDKQKPSKDSDKNGDVKEVAEENTEENATSPSIESPKSEEPKPTEAITNGEASAEEIAKPVEAKTLPEEPAKAPEEPKPEEPKPAPVEEPKTAAVEEPKVPEPVVEKPVESAPSPAKEQEEPQPVEPPIPEEKEVRNEEVPPPLPSSNPPSSVTVFAESTKADALTADQVPVLEPSITETPPRAASSPIAKTVSKPLPVVEGKVPETLVVHSDTTVPKNIEKRETEEEPVTVPSPVKLLEETVEETLPKIPESTETRSELPLELPAEIIASPVEQKPAELSKSDEETPKSPITSETILPEEQNTEKHSSEAVLDSAIKHDTNSSESPEICTNIAQTVTDELAAVITEVVPDNQEVPTESETSIVSEPEELKPHELTPASVETIPPSEPFKETPKESLESVEAQPEIISEPPVEQPESLPDPPKSPDLSTESLPSLPEPVSELEPMSLPPVESVPDPIATDCASELSLPEPIATDSAASVLSPPEAIATECAGAPVLSPPEAVATDCASATELPPPEAIATECAGAPVLSPPEAVAAECAGASELSSPEAIATDFASELSPEVVAADCACAAELSPPSDSPVLTNGSTNGLPPPKEGAVTARKSIEGPIKQVLAEPTNEVRQEEGEKKDTPVEAAAVEE